MNSRTRSQNVGIKSTPSDGSEKTLARFSVGLQAHKASEGIFVLLQGWVAVMEHDTTTSRCAQENLRRWVARKARVSGQPFYRLHTSVKA